MKKNIELFPREKKRTKSSTGVASIKIIQKSQKIEVCTNSNSKKDHVKLEVVMLNIKPVMTTNCT